MRPVRSRSQGVSVTLVVVMCLLFVLVAAGGTIGTLYAFGEIDLPFFKKPQGPPPGTVPVVVSAAVIVNGKPGPIPAYTKLTREHIWDTKEGHLACVYMEPAKIKKDMILDFNEILGRVLSHDKPPGYAFTDRDFLPKDSRSGLAGGTPPGKRAITLDATKIDGVFGLKMGDHVDLLAVIPLDQKGGGFGGGGGKMADGFRMEAEMARMQKRATVRVLAEDAVLVTPVTSHSKPTISHSLSQGAKLINVPVQEIVVAVEPDEVAMVTEALSSDGVKVTCVARSGQPGDPGTDTPGYNPLSGVSMVESIHRKDRYFVPITRFPGLPQPANANPPESHHREHPSAGKRPVN